VKESYTLGEPGKSVRLEVVTTYRRDEADEMRRTLATTPQQDLAREYLDYFAREFTEITPRGEPTSRDDRARNIVTVSESYEIRTFWKNGERELFGWQVEDHMPSSAASTRTAPLAVPHPVHVVHEITVRSPRRFKVTGRGETIAGGAFEFSSRLSVEGRVLRLTFDYRSRADAVMPQEIKAHQQSAEQVMDELSFVLADDLTESGADPGARPWGAIAVLGVVAAGAGAALVVARWRRRLRAA